MPGSRHRSVRPAARSPKLNGAVERSDRIRTEEFYEVTDAAPDLASLAAALADWEVCYNTVRPHQAS